MLVLVTRPHEQAAGTARLLERMGHAVLLDPVLEVRPLPFTPPQVDAVAALAVTSINAVPALARIRSGPAGVRGRRGHGGGSEGRRPQRRAGGGG